MKKLLFFVLMYFVVFDTSVLADEETEENYALSASKGVELSDEQNDMLIRCNKSQYSSCYELGKILKETTIGADIMIRRLFNKACNHNVTKACYELGILYQYGHGVAADRSLANSYYRKSCKLNDYNSCYQLGQNYNKGIGVRKDSKQAMDLLQRSCHNNIAKACYEIFSINKDSGINSELFALLDKSCNLQMGVACKEIGDAYYDGFTLDEVNTQDKSISYKYYNKACLLDDYTACYQIGYMLENGLGVVRNTEKALDFYAKSCESGEQEACYAQNELERKN